MQKIFHRSGKLITDDAIAKALKLTAEEYNSIVHSGLLEIPGPEDAQPRYFLVVGRNSPPDILSKLRLNMFNMVYLKASDFES